MKRLFSLGFILLTVIMLGPVSCSSKQSLPNIDEAVAGAIKTQSGLYMPGETVTEGHIILESEEDDGALTLYTLASYGEFGFENGVFTKISGSGAIPTIITFYLDGGEYSLLEYREPVDGEEYLDSLKKMFPPRLHRRVLAADKDYPALAAQQEVQAKEYLKNIGREAPVSEAYVEKEMPAINVEASNRLFAEMTKDDSLLGNCPYWLGTLERLEDGVRYIYETSQSKTNDGSDLITFRKKKEDGSLVEEKKYKIVGSEPQLLGGEDEVHGAASAVARYNYAFPAGIYFY